MGSLSMGRRATYQDVCDLPPGDAQPLAAEELEALEGLDAIYRSLCAMLYNYVPLSGHPGGSISSGRIIQSLLFESLDHDVSDPDRRDADLVSYGAGHKALGLYAIWALRDEVARIAAPELLPRDGRQRLRLEDLLGFRRNPTHDGPLFRKFGSKPLDGHPTPATPFLKLATGASGVGVASSLGLALAAADLYGQDAPRVHILDGEGGLTPGRVAEALAAAGTASLANAILHVDWNNASIDSEKVCRDGLVPGDYVAWDPRELAFLNDWNVILVPDGFDFQQVVTAQHRALRLGNGRPTAIVYRTVKGWRYGIQGKASHGAGHKLCSPGFFKAVESVVQKAGCELDSCAPGQERCQGPQGGPAVVEACFWDSLQAIRSILEKDRRLTDALALRLRRARARLDARARAPRRDAPRVEAIYELAARSVLETPQELRLKPGASTTLRAELGRALNLLNKASGGAILAGAADLLGSTSTNLVTDGFAPGFFDAVKNPSSRTVAFGGICEDGMAGMLSGVSSFGAHIGVGSSYGAFMAPLGHIAARLHAIGAQSRHAIAPDPYRTLILVCAHAGLKTGEDGPTHADPQALQVLQSAFVPGTAMTLTPWEPQEIWPLLAAALAKRPAFLAPFVTRPSEKVLDREALGLAPASAAAQGVYRLRRAKKATPDGSLVLQESGVAYAFVQDALPRLLKEGVDLDVWYVASVELFDTLPRAEQERIYPPEAAARAMGITGFTLPTMDRWVTSPRGRAATLHPFRRGHYLGSGSGESVLREAGLDGESQARAILAFVREDAPALV